MVIINVAILGESQLLNYYPFSQLCEGKYNFDCYPKIVDTTCNGINDPVNLEVACAINLCYDDGFKDCYFNKTVGITIKQNSGCHRNFNPYEVDERAKKVWDSCLNIVKNVTFSTFYVLN